VGLYSLLLICIFTYSNNPMAYPQDDLINALNDCWLLLRQKFEDPAREKYAPSSPELIALVEKHQCLDELDECGINGICGIGLGNMGGHAIG